MRWKPIEGYEGLYEISDHGDVKSLGRYYLNTETPKLTPDKILKIARSSNEYGIVSLCKKHGEKTLLVHRLVAKAFVRGYKDGLHVDHINGDKLDNRSDNLRWATASQNRHAAENHGNKKYRGIFKDRKRGRRRPWSSVIRVNMKVHFLGCSRTRKEALVLRQEAERRMLGKFARASVQCPR